MSWRVRLRVSGTKQSGRALGGTHERSMKEFGWCGRHHHKRFFCKQQRKINEGPSLNARKLAGTEDG